MFSKDDPSHGSLHFLKFGLAQYNSLRVYNVVDAKNLLFQIEIFEQVNYPFISNTIFIKVSFYLPKCFVVC